MPDMAARRALVDLFEAALAAVRGDRLAAEALAADPPRHVIAIGKAGEALAQGAWRAGGHTLRSGFLAVPRGYETGELDAGAPFARHAGAHPLPDDSSLAAGEALERYVAGLPSGEAVAVLLSGGGSACVESLAPGVDLALLRRVTSWLMASGLPIAGVNAVRARFSRLKGGGLARWLQGRPVRALVLSDVFGEGDAWVAGAPLSPVVETLPPLPGWLQKLVDSLPSPPRTAAQSLDRLAGNREAIDAVRLHGARVCGILDGTVSEAADTLVACIGQADAGTYAWGAEPTIELPAAAGRGGRCRHLGLAVAERLARRGDWTLLAAGTDGWDGTDAVAGVCVDGATAERGRKRGRDAAEALRVADSGGFFAGSGEEVVTGPTGTNVNDLVILRKG